MIHHGDALEVLRTMPEASVQCCVTSPPYYGLRDYGVEGQIGLERTPELFIERLVAVFREVRRVLKPDGVLWVNIGDSYATGAGKACSPGGGAQGENFAGPRGYKGNHTDSPKHAQVPDGKNPNACVPTFQPNRMPLPGLKPKDLIGVPWMLAFALRADGWWLRQDIIWAKPNPMPGSVKDRCTKAHEYLFLMTKSERYYYDAAALFEPLQTAEKENYPARAKITGRGEQSFNGDNARAGDRDKSGGFPPSYKGSTFTRGKTGEIKPTVGHGERVEAPGRNRRSVWVMATCPTPEAHFATFPIDLAQDCILAGSKPGDTILDPFAGAGTTGLACLKHGREFVGIELNAAYIDIANERARKHYPLLVTA
jgi:DNA modification methylase